MLKVLNRSHKMLPLSEYVKVPDLISKFKELYAKIVEIYHNN